MNPDQYNSLDGYFAAHRKNSNFTYQDKEESYHAPMADSIRVDNADSSTSLSQSCDRIYRSENLSSFCSNNRINFHGHECSPAFSDYSPCSRSEQPLNVVRTRRRKAGISDEDRICIVCGEPASGYNFDRLTCESCKAFFRRNALKPKDKIKACNRGGGCIVEGNQRKHCPSCRLQKCFAVGMKRELILPPEKLEQRAKPRRRKANSPQSDACYPSTPISVSHSRHSSRISSGLHSGSHQPLVPNAQQSVFNSSAHPSIYDVIHRPVLNPIDSNPTDYRPWPVEHFTESNLEDKYVIKPELPSLDTNRCLMVPRLFPCRHTNLRTMCRHRRCRRNQLRNHHHHHNDVNDDNKLSAGLPATEPDAHLLNCLRECAQRIRDPFTPDENLDTGVALTLEQEYNRMDACIRRIIRVVKLLPHFNDTGKQAQLGLLRANIYGLLVLYSSFFYERGIRKLRYPLLQANGEKSFVTVSMLDEVVSPTSVYPIHSNDNLYRLNSRNGSSANLLESDFAFSSESRQSSELREEFELYKVNTLAAFDHLDQLIGSDDILRVTVLAIKLFTDDSVSLDELHESVENTRQIYLLFLWAYLRWRAGPKQLRLATELYARLLISFIDLRTLEIRMTNFAKLLSLDCLSPLMREVCSQRPINGMSA